MAFANYTDLQISIHKWLGDDAQVARIPGMIELFEGKVRRELRVRRMEARAVANTVAGQKNLAVPADFVATRSLHLNLGTPVQLNFQPVNQLMRLYGNEVGTPAAYAVVGSEYIFAPAPAGEYQVESDYYSFTGLSDAAPNNWLLEDYPDAYLYGALSYSRGPDIAAWLALTDAILEQIRNGDRSERWNGPPLARRVDFVAA